MKISNLKIKYQPQDEEFAFTKELAYITRLFEKRICPFAIQRAFRNHIYLKNPRKESHAKALANDGDIEESRIRSPFFTENEKSHIREYVNRLNLSMGPTW